jgi:hypothetical protein
VEYFRENSCMGVVLVDLTALARIERSFGATAYKTLRSQVDPLLAETKAHVRDDDILTRDERDSDRYLFFLTGKRKTKNPFAAVDLQRLCDRVEAFVTPRVARLTTPYMRERPAIEVGQGFSLWSPLENEERQILRLIEDARTSADLRRKLPERTSGTRWSRSSSTRASGAPSSPSCRWRRSEIVGYEGLSRGPRGGRSSTR